jgi:hypothetical protein
MGLRTWLREWICTEDEDAGNEKKRQNDAPEKDVPKRRREESTKADRDSRKALVRLGLAMVIGLVVVIAFAFQTRNVAAGVAVLTTAAITAGAALVVGGTLGFIFGIPRTRSGDQEKKNGANGQGGEGNQANESSPATNGAHSAPAVEGNTNLEEISDWLTKMLVGVGLTQLYKVPREMESLTKYVAKGLKGPDNAPLLLVPAEAFALGLIVYFLFVGFLFGYLWTRFILTGALTRDAVGRLRGELAQQTKHMLSAEEKTWNRVRQQLYARETEVVVPQEELDQAIKAASRETKAGIFYEAARLRRETWQHDKQRMERTIRIFRALCRDDKDKVYHASHGQLGFALKDKEFPTQADYLEAEKELTAAIEIRDRVDGGRIWPYYEFNRAICRIKLNRPVEDIKADLRKAYEVPYFRELIDQKSDEIKNWKVANNIANLDAPPQP